MFSAWMIAGSTIIKNEIRLILTDKTLCFKNKFPEVLPEKRQREKAND